MNRDEHLAWCKKRALEYLDRGDDQQAFTSMLSDLTKHEDTAKHIGIELGMTMMMVGFLNTSDSMRRWIVGFN